MRESKTHIEQRICEREREALIDISFKIAHDLSFIHPSIQTIGD